MAVSPIEMDVERLLAPISAESPVGASLRYEGTYDRVREARREDDPTLPQGVWVSRLKLADWKGVAALCGEALERRSKDLQLAVWLAEAWLQIGGFSAAVSGFQLMAGLCDRYWDTMFPEIADAGWEPRANLIEWFDDAAARKIRLLPLLHTEQQPPLCLATWEAGLSPGVSSEDQSDAQAGQYSAVAGSSGTPDGGRERLLAQISLVDRAHWTALHREVGAALAAADALDNSLAARMTQPPILHRTRGALRGIKALLEVAVGELKKDEPIAPATGTPDDLGTISAEAAPSRALGAPIRSRAEAYRLLAEAADYLLRTEPHSPVPYLVKRAISWGNMSLAELLGEFVSGADDLVTIYRLLGMRGRDERDDG